MGGDNGTEDDDDKALFASMMESESSLSKFLRTKVMPVTRRHRRASMTSCSRSSSSKTSPTSSITEIEISETTEDLSGSLSLGEDEIWWSLKDSDTTSTRGSSVIDVSSRSDTIKSSSRNNKNKHFTTTTNNDKSKRKN